MNIQIVKKVIFLLKVRSSFILKNSHLRPHHFHHFQILLPHHPDPHPHRRHHHLNQAWWPVCHLCTELQILLSVSCFQSLNWNAKENFFWAKVLKADIYQIIEDTNFVTKCRSRTDIERFSWAYPSSRSSADLWVPSVYEPSSGKPFILLILSA